eukprot:m.35707 g.35707  ORF g.35707 m.35707 type:complete len:94 (+) comp10039_c1_seq1:314-595(+)
MDNYEQQEEENDGDEDAQLQALLQTKLDALEEEKTKKREAAKLNERKRMHQINKGFSALRSSVPKCIQVEKMSKVCVNKLSPVTVTVCNCNCL